MRHGLLIAAVLLLFTACGHAKKNSHTFSDAKTSSKAREGKKQPAPTQEFVPAQQTLARIVSVNSNLRFVVLQCSVGVQPKIDQRLFCYRNGTRSGEVKVTGPFNGLNVAADILSGSIQAGDEARAD